MLKYGFVFVLVSAMYSQMSFAEDFTGHWVFSGDAQVSCENGYTTTDCFAGDVTIEQSSDDIQGYSSGINCDRLGTGDLHTGALKTSNNDILATVSYPSDKQGTTVAVGKITENDLQLDMDALRTIQSGGNYGAVLSMTFNRDTMTVKRLHIVHLKVSCDYTATYKRVFP